MSDFDQELNAIGMACPLPILKTKKMIAGMSPEQVLKITASDFGTYPISPRKDPAAGLKQ